jgi:hypothetical protein
MSAARVLHVHRGEMRIDWPVPEVVLREVPVSALAEAIVTAALRLQLVEPERATEPLPLDDTPLALRVAGRDTALLPHLPLLMQTAGLWTDADLPVQGQSERTARLPVIALQLVNEPRSAVVL